MEYIFGTVRRNGELRENLKTVGDEHSELTGFVEKVREFDDGSTIVDRFRVVEKYRQLKDAEGNCYDWYVIDQHYRYEDKSRQAEDKITGLMVALAEAVEALTGGENDG